MMKDLFYGISAGLLIGIGGTVFLSCDNRYIGAVLFAVALLCICAKGYSLFTGKVGFMAYNHKKADFINLVLCLFGNLIGTALSGILINKALPAVAEKAVILCEPKLLQDIPTALIRAVFCGMLMYLAVALYREKSTFAGVFFCVPVFILSGFEHSIADMFYFFVSGKVTLQIALYLVLIILGNTIGGLVLPCLGLLAENKPVTPKTSATIEVKQEVSHV